MSFWRPISSVPRDGTLVIVADIEAGAFPMRWNPEGYNRLVSKNGGLWEASDKSFTWSEEHGFGPTYWTELDSGADIKDLPPHPLDFHPVGAGRQ